MNPSVSRVNSNVRFFRSTAFVLGLIQGAEFVTIRATEMVKGASYHYIHRLTTQPAARDVEGFPVPHPRELDSVFPEVR